jgi:hypothetical protein
MRYDDRTIRDAAACVVADLFGGEQTGVGVMKIFGRLLMAAALIVPIGVATAQSAGAGTLPSVSGCSGSGTIKAKPGLLLRKTASQTFGVTGAALTGCTGDNGGASGSASLTLSVQSPSSSNCKTVRGKINKGAGKIVWSQAHAGTSTIKINVEIVGSNTVKITGKVTSTDYKGQAISGSGSFTPNLNAKGTAGGGCTLNSKLKTLALTVDSFAIAGK